VAGCGGSGNEQQQRLLVTDDLIGIVPMPETPDGANYNADDHSATLTLADFRQRAQTSEDKALATALGKAGLRQIYQRTFVGALNQADASLFLFRKPEGAGTAFGLLKTSLQKPGSIAQKVTTADSQGLGVESWAAHLTGAGTDAGLVLWRNGNLVGVTDMSCDDACDFDAVGSARAYAAVIDDLVNQSAATQR